MSSIVAVIPLYNGARWIENSLRSVLAQTHMPDEVIVVDDGSTDGGAGSKIVEQIQSTRQFPIIRLLHKQNGGQSQARNFAIRQSKCDLIALLDQDDRWYPNHLERLLRPFGRANRGSGMPLGWVYANMDQIDERGMCIRHSFLDSIPASHPKRSIFDCLKENMYVLPSASLFTRQAFDAVGGFDERLCGYEDDDFFMRQFAAGFDNVYLNERLSQWRIYPSSTSYTDKMAISRGVYAKKQIEMFPDRPDENLYLVRDLIAPRFLAALKDDHERAVKRGDTGTAARCRAEIIATATHLPKGSNLPVRVFANVLGLRFKTKFSPPRWLAVWLLANTKKTRLA